MGASSWQNKGHREVEEGDGGRARYGCERPSKGHGEVSPNQVRTDALRATGSPSLGDWAQQKQSPEYPGRFSRSSIVIARSVVGFATAFSQPPV